MKVKMTAVLAGAVFAVSANAATIVVDFGSGSNVGGSLTPYTTPGTASQGTSISLGTSLTIAGGAVIVTPVGSSTIFCQQGSNVGFCGTSSGVTAVAPELVSGIGIGSAAQTGNAPSRIDSGQSLVFTTQPGYTVTLLSFAVTDFGTPSGGEGATYSINGGAGVAFAPQAAALDTFDPVDFGFATLSFTANAGSDYAFQSITLDVVQTAPVPEPATLGVVGIALAGLWAARRRKLS